MRTLIAIPCMDTVPVGFVQSLLNLDKPEGTSVCFKANSLVYDSRNLLSLTAMEQNFDRVLWLDSDMQVPPNLLRWLSEDMNELDCDLITGLYFKRRFPFSPVIYNQLEQPAQTNGMMTKMIREYENYPQNERFRIDGCGFGCCLTSVSLLKRVWDRFGPAFHPFPWAGEDLSFCYRAKQLDAHMYCDSRILCGHIGTFIYNEQTFQDNRGEKH